MENPSIQAHSFLGKPHGIPYFYVSLLYTYILYSISMLVYYRYPMNLFVTMFTIDIWWFPEIGVVYNGAFSGWWYTYPSEKI